MASLSSWERMTERSTTEMLQINYPQNKNLLLKVKDSHLQVFVVGAGQALQCHHEACTLQYRQSWVEFYRKTATSHRNYKSCPEKKRRERSETLSCHEEKLLMGLWHTRALVFQAKWLVSFSEQKKKWCNKSESLVRRLTLPKTRPALLLISSRLSAFFFWGIRLLPVLHTHTHTHTQPRVIWYKGSNVWQTALWWLKCSSDGPTGSGSVDTGEFLLHQVITSEQHGRCFSFYRADSCFSRMWVTRKRNGSSKPWNIFHNMHININVYFPPPSFSITWRQLCSSWPNMISDFPSCFSTFLWIFPVGK